MSDFWSVKWLCAARQQWRGGCTIVTPVENLQMGKGLQRAKHFHHSPPCDVILEHKQQISAHNAMIWLQSTFFKRQCQSPHPGTWQIQTAPMPWHGSQFRLHERPMPKHWVEQNHLQRMLEQHGINSQSLILLFLWCTKSHLVLGTWQL